MTQMTPPNAKSKMTAILLALIGVLGIHGIQSFYLGFTTKGILQLITCGGCGIWTLIDIIFLATGKIDKDAQGNPLI